MAARDTDSHSLRAHAICSASGAERWLNCPGSVGLQMTIPDVESSPAAKEGTRAHELAERILRRWEANGRKLDLQWVESLRPEFADTETPTANPGIMWSMVDYAMTYVNCCLDEVESFDPGTEVNVRIEHRLVLDQKLGMFGTVDFFATGLRGGRAYGVVVDFKYGRKKVKTAENPQLAYYSVALKRSSKKALETIKVRVIQPRLDDFYSDTEYTREELEAWDLKLRKGATLALSMSRQETTPAYKTGGWCYFCTAWSICPERIKAAQKKAAELFEDAEPLLLVEA